jgi:hypothetical protein
MLRAIPGAVVLAGRRPLFALAVVGLALDEFEEIEVFTRSRRT